MLLIPKELEVGGLHQHYVSTGGSTPSPLFYTTGWYRRVAMKLCTHFVAESIVSFQTDDVQTYNNHRGLNEVHCYLCECMQYTRPSGDFKMMPQTGCLPIRLPLSLLYFAYAHKKLKHKIHSFV